MAETSCPNCALLERRLATLNEERDNARVERDKAQTALEGLLTFAEASYSDNAWWWQSAIEDALTTAGMREKK